MKEQQENLLKELKGKVWSANIHESALLELEKDYRIGNVVRREDGVEVRIISDTKPIYNAVIQEPRLEDIYLYFFDEEVEVVS